MDLRDLQLLEVLAERGSLTATAETLQISQPSTTARLGNIETALQVRLFTRDRSGTHLTPAGERYLPYVRRIRALLDDGERAARADITTLRVGIPASYAAALAPALLDAADPAQVVTIRTAHSEQLRSQLLDGTLDLALTGETTLPAGLTTTPCITTRLVALAPPGTTPAASSRWAIHAWGALEREVGAVLLERQIPRHQITTVAPSSAAIALATAGTHIAIVPALTAQREITEHALEPLNIGLGDTTITLTWIHRPGPTAALQTLIRDTTTKLHSNETEPSL